MCSKHNSSKSGLSFWVLQFTEYGMSTDQRPSVGYDKYFSDQSASPRADLAPLLTSLGQKGLPKLNRNHAIGLRFHLEISDLSLEG